MYSSEMIMDLFKKESLPGNRCQDQDIYLTEDQVFLALNTLIEEKKFNKEQDVPNWEIWLHLIIFALKEIKHDEPNIFLQELNKFMFMDDSHDLQRFKNSFELIKLIRYFTAFLTLDEFVRTRTTIDKIGVKIEAYTAKQLQDITNACWNMINENDFYLTTEFLNIYKFLFLYINYCNINITKKIKKD